MKEGNIYEVRHNINRRLAEMGLIRGSRFRVTRIVFGMICIRLKDYTLAIRQDIINELELNEIIQ